jgi:hypothetical protein
MWGKLKLHTKFFQEISRDETTWEDLHIDGRKKLQGIIKKQGVKT